MARAGPALVLVLCWVTAGQGQQGAQSCTALQGCTGGVELHQHKAVLCSCVAALEQHCLVRGGTFLLTLMGFFLPHKTDEKFVWYLKVGLLCM